jgi:hypothetical protein
VESVPAVPSAWMMVCKKRLRDTDAVQKMVSRCREIGSGDMVCLFRQAPSKAFQDALGMFGLGSTCWSLVVDDVRGCPRRLPASRLACLPSRVTALGVSSQMILEASLLLNIALARPLQ